MNEQTQNNRQRSHFLKILFLFNIQKVNPLKPFGKHYLDRGSVHASEISWAHGKIQHKIHPEKIYKMSMKHLKIHKFPFKNVMVLAIECEKCTWKFSKNFTAFVAFQKRPCAPSWRKQGWIPWRTISW